MDAKEISVANEFSTRPFGRFRSDGPDSGERFRDDFLEPALAQFGVVTVNLDGTLGYGSSFLEEAFGGLVRVKGLSAKDLRARMRIVSSRPSYERRVWQFILEARPA